MTSDSDRILADTHTLLWYFTESPRISATADKLLQEVELGNLELVVPTIVLAEAIRVTERKNPGISYGELIERLKRIRTTLIVALDSAILDEVLRLPSSIEMHDRIIAATARVYGAKLVSRDRVFGGVVETVW
jgi:predicted nucleic acid-binding protein